MVDRSASATRVPAPVPSLQCGCSSVLLPQDIQDLLESWAELLTEASAIFLRAPSYNKTIFFGGRGAPLDKKDPRIRTLPFATRRATFREVQRVHSLLSTVQTFGEGESPSTRN